jgi:hypothetical protein
MLDHQRNSRCRSYNMSLQSLSRFRFLSPIRWPSKYWSGVLCRLQLQKTHENRHMILFVGVDFLLHELVNHHLVVVVHLCCLQKHNKFSDSCQHRQTIKHVACEAAGVGRHTFHKADEQHWNRRAATAMLACESAGTRRPSMGALGTGGAEVKVVIS